jgi:O2-independent ubiquinone biosynthesis accessory factor UbiT
MNSLEAAPPFSPALLLGMAARPLPPGAIEAVLRLALGRVRMRHAEMFDRLRPLAETAFLIDAVDVPFKIVLRPGAQPPDLTVLRDGDTAPATAVVIAGTLSTLIELLEGRADGDALFFSRDLTIEGNMEAALILRNALDGADIEVFETLLSTLGPFAGPARLLAQPGRALARRLGDDMARLQAALTAPLARQYAAQAAAVTAEMAALEDRIGKPRRHAPRRPAQHPARRPARSQDG